MPDRRQVLMSAAALASLAMLRAPSARANISITLTSHYQVVRFIDADSVEMINGHAHAMVRRGETFLGCTLVDVVPGDFVVMEDFTAIDGDMLVVDLTGVRWRLGKTAEGTGGGPDLHGHTADEIASSTGDLLADDLLSGGGDPVYEDVAAILPPISHVTGDMWNFIGPRGGPAVPFAADGTCTGFDAAVFQPSIASVRAGGGVLTGLVGGYLPCVRFVYPEGVGTWTETLAYVALDDGPVHGRVARIEGGKLAWVKGMVAGSAGAVDGDGEFHAGLAALKAGWDKALAPGMKVDLPDGRLADMARHSLVRAMISGGGGVASTLAAWGLGDSSVTIAPFSGPTRLSLPLDGQGRLAGDDAAGEGYAAIAADRIPQALLTTWSAMAHLATRGGWMAVAGRSLLDGEALPYSATAQAAVPFLLRELLAFEDQNTLWLGRGMPKAWLADGKLVFIDDIATRWGRISFATDSRISKEHRIAAKVVFPAAGIGATTRFRFRTGQPIRHVTLGDKSWKDFDAASGEINLPAGMGGTVILEIRY